MSRIKSAVGALERRLAGRAWFFHAYTFPYRALLKRELRLAAVQSDDVVLNIGCGSAPFSAVLAAQFSGARVIAVDLDPRAVTGARSLVARLGFSSRIEVLLADASKDPLPPASVALVALQAAPKDDIWHNLQHSLSGSGERGRALFRIPRAGLESTYGHFAPGAAVRGEVYHRMPTFERTILCTPRSVRSAGKVA